LGGIYAKGSTAPSANYRTAGEKVWDARAAIEKLLLLLSGTQKKVSQSMKHVVLLGDSIFDNRAYVGDGPDVITQLQEKLSDWRASLLAVDGSMTRNVREQIVLLPDDASHLILSIGGNDALNSANVLNHPAFSTSEALLQLASKGDQFEYDYRKMLDDILMLKLPTALCTIYYPRMPELEYQRLAVTGLTIFNDCIIRVAFAAGLPLIDLRFVCNEDGDYANPIEPSVQGGEKITGVIKQLLLKHDFEQNRTSVFI
jgi:GDSL-like Lipase/Acylhydrolase family